MKKLVVVAASVLGSMLLQPADAEAQTGDCFDCVIYAGCWFCVLYVDWGFYDCATPACNVCYIGPPEFCYSLSGNEPTELVADAGSEGEQVDYFYLDSGDRWMLVRECGDDPAFPQTAGAGERTARHRGTLADTAWGPQPAVRLTATRL